MSTIRIKEFSGDDDQNAKVRFDTGIEYPITIHNPFSGKDEKQLEWFFEEHLIHPYTDEERAIQAADSIKHYGERLFNQVFSDPDVYEQYKDIAKSSIEKVRFEIVGSPSFHAIHWEALKDPDLSKPFSLETSIVRKNTTPLPHTYTIKPSSTLNILVVTARPGKQHDADYRTISRPLVELIDQSQLQVKIDLLRPRTYEALRTHLDNVRKENNDQGYYHIIHFDTHGMVQNYKAFIAFEGTDGETTNFVEACKLAGLLELHQIPIAVLNACQSGKQVGESETSLGSYLAQAGTQLVVAMSYSITITAAKILMERLYRDLFNGNDCLAAVRSGRLELYDNKGRQAYFNQEIDLEDWLLPVVYQNQDIDLQLREFKPEVSTKYDSKRADAYPFPTPEFGFFGRDLDILAIEDLLLRKDSSRLSQTWGMLKTLLIEGRLLRKDGGRRRNIVMIRGLGGAGKTTLLKHLGAWLQKTRFVDKVVYFGYDEAAWTCCRIVDSIAKKVLDDERYKEFIPMKSTAQQEMMADLLHLERHLLVLDNFESVTGDVTTTQHALPKEDQDHLRTFLTSLAGGNTSVLIGTRGREDWLIGDGGPLRLDDIYDLPGLDPEAASMLADQILERNKIDKGYRKDEDFNTILKLLDGYPMAMEVILPNLKSRKPSEVLEGLQKGDIALDKKGATGRMEGLIQSIEYSFGNISEDRQHALLCLAPFTSIIHKDVLDIYMENLYEQSAMSQILFDKYSNAISEATDWGLLSQHDGQLRFWKLQPILPFFLRNRLKEKKYPEILDALNIAFIETYRETGAYYYELLDSKEASKHKLGIFLVNQEYENLLSALNLTMEKRGSVRAIYYPISVYLDAENRHAEGLVLGKHVLDLLQKYPLEDLNRQIKTEIVEVISGIGKRQLLLKRPEDSWKSYKLALEMHEKIKNITEEDGRLSADICHQLGRLAQEKREWQQAEEYYKESLKIDEKFKNRESQASTYHQLGRISQEKREWQQAEEYYKESLKIDKEFKNRGPQASTLHNLGYLAQEQRKWEQAEEYYREALVIKKEFNYLHSQAYTYHQQGNMALEKQEWQQAEEYYRKALEIYGKFTNRYSQAGIYNNLGIVAQKQQEWQQAEQYYRKALAIKKEFKNRYPQASTYHQLGEVAREQQEWQQAEQCYRKALEIFKESKDDYSTEATLRNFSQLWKETGSDSIPQVVAEILEMSSDEAKELLEKVNE